MYILLYSKNIETYFINGCLSLSSKNCIDMVYKSAYFPKPLSDPRPQDAHQVLQMFLGVSNCVKISHVYRVNVFGISICVSTPRIYQINVFWCSYW